MQTGLGQLATTTEYNWSLDPVLIGGLLAYLFTFTVRWIKLRRSGIDPKRGVQVYKLLLTLLGLAAAVAALLSPIDVLGERLISMHMVQHVLLLDVVPILLLLGLSKVTLRPVTKHLLTVEKAAGPFAKPAFALIFYCAAIWIWHIPALYELAVTNETWHIVEHITFLSAGFLFWWHLISPLRSRIRFGGAGPVVYIAGSKLIVGALGLALTFSPQLIYNYYANQQMLWGLSPEEDQAVAGLIMALEQSIIVGIAVVYLFMRMLSENEE